MGSVWLAKNKLIARNAWHIDWLRTEDRATHDGNKISLVNTFFVPHTLATINNANNNNNEEPKQYWQKKKSATRGHEQEKWQ